MKSALKMILAAACASLLAVGSNIAAQPVNYPTKAIRLVTPFPPGGGTDAVARIAADKLSVLLGQAVVVENKAGAGGSLGTELAARAAADGYTLVLGSSATHAVNASLYPELSYDPVKDFAAVSTLATTPLLLMANASVPAKSVSELIDVSKTREAGKTMTYASAGVGSAQHLGAELFKSMTKAPLLHVPYKGAGPAMVDLLAGHVDIAFDTMPSALAQIKSDKLKVLGISSPERSNMLPDVPAIAETVPGYELVTWYGLFAPAGTPPAVVDTLNAAVKRMLESEDVQAKFKTAGIEPYWSSPADFSTLVKNEIPKWRKVIEQSGAKIE